MSKKIRILSLILAAVMLLPACSNATPKDTAKDTSAPASNQDTEAATEAATEAEAVTETEVKPQTPAKTFGGADISIIYRGPEALTYVVSDAFVEDGASGDIVDQAVFNRNEKIKTEFDVNLTFTPAKHATSDMKTDVTAGTKEFDIISDQMDHIVPTGAQNVFFNINNFTYIKPESPWWDANSFKMSIANRLYCIVGDISMNASARARFVYYNKAIHEQYHLDDPYKLVDEGKWTLDALTGMVHAVYEDVDSSGTPNATDVFGLVSKSYNYFATGAGVIYTGKDENDIPTVTCINERTVDVLAKIKELHEYKPNVTDYAGVTDGEDTSAYLNTSDYVRGLFASGHFLFIQNGADCAYQFADMEDAYGIIPCPKYDEAQESYYHLMDSMACGWAVSSMCDDYEMIDIFMDNWAYSSGGVVDAFYETTMKGKRADSPDDARMLDLVRNSIVYELSLFYDIGLSSILTNGYSSGNLMSNWKSQSRIVEKKLEKLGEDYGSDQ